MLFKNYLKLTLLFLSLGIKAGPGSSCLTYNRRDAVVIFSTVNNDQSLPDPNVIQVAPINGNHQAQAYGHQLRYPTARRDDLRRMVLDNPQGQILEQRRILDNPQRWAMALANAPQNQQRVFNPRGNR